MKEVPDAEEEDEQLASFDDDEPHFHPLADNANGEAPVGTKAIAVSSNKILTSKYRGVCWNRKNKRWQTAINSAGKYLYLGSYNTQEEAARVFDKAAVRVRGAKARLNFKLSNYIDADGNIIPDPTIDQLLAEAQDPNRPRRQRGTRKDGPGTGPVQPPPPEAAAIVAAGGSGLPGDEGRSGKQGSRGRSGSSSLHTHTVSGAAAPSTGGKAGTGSRVNQAIESLAAAVVAAAQLPASGDAGPAAGHLQLNNHNQQGYASSSPYAVQQHQKQQQLVQMGAASYTVNGSLSGAMMTANPGHEQHQHAPQGASAALQYMVHPGQSYPVSSGASILVNGQQVMLPVAQASMGQGLGSNLVLNSQGQIVQLQPTNTGPQDHANNCGASHARPGAQAVYVGAPQNPARQNPSSPAAQQQHTHAAPLPFPRTAAGDQGQAASLQRGPPSAAPAPLAQQQDQKGTAQTAAGGSPVTAPPNAVGVPSVEQQVALLMPCLPPGASLKCVITGTEKMTGAVFEDPSKRYGAAVLNSGTFHDLGRYDSSEDAKQACQSTLRVLLATQQPAQQPTPAAPAAGSQPVPSQHNGTLSPKAGITQAVSQPQPPPSQLTAQDVLAQLQRGQQQQQQRSPVLQQEHHQNKASVSPNVMPVATPSAGQQAQQQVVLIGDWSKQGQGFSGLQLQHAQNLGMQPTTVLTQNGGILQMVQQQPAQQQQQQFAFVLGSGAGGQTGVSPHAGQAVLTSSNGAPNLQAMPMTLQPHHLGLDPQQQQQFHQQLQAPGQQHQQQQQPPQQQPAPFQLLLSGGGLGMDSGLLLLPHPATSTTSLSLPGSINDAFSLPNLGMLNTSQLWASGTPPSGAGGPPNAPLGRHSLSGLTGPNPWQTVLVVEPDPVHTTAGGHSSVTAHGGMRVLQQQVQGGPAAPGNPYAVLSTLPQQLPAGNTADRGEEGPAAKRARLNDAAMTMGGGMLSGPVMMPGKGFTVGSVSLDQAQQQQGMTAGISLAPTLTTVGADGRSQSMGSVAFGSGVSAVTAGGHAINGFAPHNGFAAMSGLMSLNVQDALQMYSSTNAAGNR